MFGGRFFLARLGVQTMPDFAMSMTNLDGDDQWVDVTGEFVAGDRVSVQNCGDFTINLFFGTAAPTSHDAGIVLAARNWPLFEHVVETKIWARGRGRLHLSQSSAANDSGGGNDNDGIDIL